MALNNQRFLRGLLGNSLSILFKVSTKTVLKFFILSLNSLVILCINNRGCLTNQVGQVRHCMVSHTDHEPGNSNQPKVWAEKSE